MESLTAFDYIATDDSGRQRSGSVSAEDREAARRELEQQGLRVVSLNEKTGSRPGREFTGRVSTEDFLTFNRHLASVTKRGASLPDGLKALLADIAPGEFQRVVEEVLAEVEAGRPLSDALRKRKDVFSGLYINFVRAGEESGNLSAVLSLVAKQSQGLSKVRQRVIEALFYPSIVIVAVSILLFYIGKGVIPHFYAMFCEMDLPLPGLTRLLFIFWTSDVVYATLGVILFGIVFLWVAGERTAIGQRLLDWIVFFAPLLKEIRQSYGLARVCELMSILLRGGVPLTDALGVVSTSADSPSMRYALMRAAVDVSEGHSLSDSLKERGPFPSTMTWLVHLGEETGELPDAFEDAADLYEARATRSAAVLDTFLVPILIVATGAIVAVTVMAMFMPLISLMEKMGG